MKAMRTRQDAGRPKPPRKPLTAAFDDALYKASRDVASLRRLTGDDRLKATRQTIAARYHRRLTNLRDELNDVIEALGEPSRNK